MGGGSLDAPLPPADHGSFGGPARRGLREVPEALHVRRTIHQATCHLLARSVPYTLVFTPCRSDAWLPSDCPGTLLVFRIFFRIFGPFRTSF